MTQGTVIQVIDHGTIVQVVIEDEGGRPHFINFDHSPFRWFVDAEGMPYEGQVLSVDYDEDGNQLVEVLS